MIICNQISRIDSFFECDSRRNSGILLLNVAEFILYVGNSGILSQGMLSCNLRVYQGLKSLVKYNMTVPSRGLLLILARKLKYLIVLVIIMD